ncbi:MAG: ornithine carbamoyltransferase, partial [Hydrogenobaculum sp.]
AYNLESYFDMYGITKERYNKIRGFLMHPGPVNRDVDIDGELLYKDKSLIANQIENGVFVRMAMIEHILG